MKTFDIYKKINQNKKLVIIGVPEPQALFFINSANEKFENYNNEIEWIMEENNGIVSFKTSACA